MVRDCIVHILESLNSKCNKFKSKRCKVKFKKYVQDSDEHFT